ncbi:hypothetical protein NDU88_007675 [Pleurodeles waltl]|uniref:Uncharacterized protein n=1 Tax=Pleurodeles waltl TaxID=8319 RepID=A0AAV7RQZ0_PLEWA|nr:hypothetical protein NDU88_007675 [Pleurodeles waltl]
MEQHARSGANGGLRVSDFILCSQRTETRTGTLKNEEHLMRNEIQRFEDQREHSAMGTRNASWRPYCREP